MKIKRTKVSVWLRGLLFLVVMLFWGSNGLPAATMGTTIDKHNYKEYESLLSPAMILSVQNGDWTYPTGNLKYSYKHSNPFLRASEKNAGKFDTNSTGWLIDKSTGKYPAYNVYGFPFPQIDPKDPKAATKIIWNFAFQHYRFMGEARENVLNWLRKHSGSDRVVVTDSLLLFYQGRPPGQEIKNNPQKLLMSDLSLTKAPMDARGSNTMGWEYLDDTDTTVFSYLAPIRRIRRNSGATRSDPYMGCDMWADSKNGFAGKIASFDWKLLGERELLVAFPSLEKKTVPLAPDGSMTFSYQGEIKFGYQTPGWKGASWAYTNVVWVPRRVWIIEGMPKDPYYTFGKHIFYVDKETYTMFSKEVYNKAGQMWVWFVELQGAVESSDESKNCFGGFIYGSVVDLIKSHGTAIDSSKATIFLPVTSLSPDFFTTVNLLKLSK